MINQGAMPSPEIVFAFRILMVRYNLSPVDVLGVLAAIDKENAPPGEDVPVGRRL